MSGSDGEWESRMTVTVYAHLHTATALAYHLPPRAAGRMTLEVSGTNSADLVLFADRAGLARLITTATAALAELDAQAGHTDQDEIPAAPAA